MPTSSDVNVIQCQRHPIPQYRHLYDDLCQSHQLCMEIWSCVMALHINPKVCGGTSRHAQALYVKPKALGNRNRRQEDLLGEQDDILGDQADIAGRTTSSAGGTTSSAVSQT
jgi:hypothetical protein